MRAYANVFIGRHDLYALQEPDGSYRCIKEPLDMEMVVEAHVRGELTLGAYALDAGSQARWICLDADKYDYWSGLLNLAQQLENQDISSYLEQSRRGGHLWLFLPTIPGTLARQFGQRLIAEHNLPPDIELFPKQDKLTTGPGSLVRLPLGVHRKDGWRYGFITTEGKPLAPTVREQVILLSQPQHVPNEFIRAMLSKAGELPPVCSPPPRNEVPGATVSERLKASITVREFVGQYVELDKSGKGRCPFHDDQHPSFQVNDENAFWHCYAGCGGGSIIDFEMKRREQQGEDGSFTATVRALAKQLL